MKPSLVVSALELDKVSMHFDVRVFTQIHKAIDKLPNSKHTNHKCKKLHAYGKKIRESETAALLPWYSHQPEAWDREATTCYKRVARLIADKQDSLYRQSCR